jgi:hypothetical protein
MQPALLNLATDRLPNQCEAASSRSPIILPVELGLSYPNQNEQIS